MPLTTVYQLNLGGNAQDATGGVTLTGAALIAADWPNDTAFQTDSYQNDSFQQAAGGSSSSYTYDGSGVVALTGLSTQQDSGSYSAAGGTAVTGLSTQQVSGAYGSSGGTAASGQGGVTDGALVSPSGGFTATGLSTQRTSGVYDSSGGPAAGGTADERTSGAYAPAGGFAVSGLSTQQDSGIFAASGGTAASGQGGLTDGALVAPSGGVTLSGTADENVSVVYAATGGFTVSGLALAFGGASYFVDAVGGLTVSGLSTQRDSGVYDSSGGQAPTGTADERATGAYTPAGGFAASGLSTQQDSGIFAASGGTAASGVSTQRDSGVFDSAGGASLSGAALTDVSVSQSQDATGGVTLSGVAAQQGGGSYAAAGSASISGLAAASFGFSASGTGGLSLSGVQSNAATAKYLPSGSFSPTGTPLLKATYKYLAVTGSLAGSGQAEAGSVTTDNLAFSGGTAFSGTAAVDFQLHGSTARLVQDPIASGTLTATIEWAEDTTDGSLLVAALWLNNSAVSVLTVPTGYVLANRSNLGTDGSVAIYYARDADPRSSDTWIVSNGRVVVISAEFQNIKQTLPVIDVSKTGGTASPVASWASGTTAALGSKFDLVVAAFAYSGSDHPVTSPTNGWTIDLGGTTVDDFAGLTLLYTLAPGNQLSGANVTVTPSSSGSFSSSVVAFTPASFATWQIKGGGHVSLSGSATATYNHFAYAMTGDIALDGVADAVRGFRWVIGVGGHTLTGQALVIRRHFDQAADGDISFGGTYPKWIHVASGGFHVRGQGSINKWNAIGSFVISGQSLEKASYVYKAAGGSIAFGGGPFVMRGGVSVTGTGSLRTAATVPMSGRVALTGRAVLAERDDYAAEMTGRFRIRGKATCGITYINLAFAASGKMYLDGDAQAMIWTAHFLYDAGGSLGKLKGSGSGAVTRAYFITAGGGEFQLDGVAGAAITYLNLAYKGGGRVAVSGDSTEVISSLNLSYRGGGEVGLSGEADAWPPMVGHGGARLTGAASAAVGSVGYQYSSTGGRVRLTGRALVVVSNVYEHEAEGEFSLDGVGRVFGTGQRQVASGGVALSGLATCRPGAAVRMQGQASLTGLASSSYLVTFFHAGTGGASLTGQALVQPPLHQTGGGGLKLTGVPLVQRGWVTAFDSPQWWQNYGRFYIKGAAKVEGGVAAAAGGGGQSLGGSALVTGPVSGNGGFTMTGQASAGAGPSVAMAGSLGGLSGVQEPPVLGQKVVMAGRFAVSGVADAGTNFHYATGTGGLKLAGAARATSFVNVGSQESDGSASLAGEASDAWGYNFRGDGQAVLTGGAAAAWGYSFAAGGELGVTGHAPLENSFVYEPEGGFSPNGRAFLRLVLFYLYSSSERLGSLSGVASFGPAYEYSGTGGLRASGAASAVTHQSFSSPAGGAVVLGGRAHAISTARYAAAMAGRLAFGGSNDRQTANRASAAGGLGLRGECSTSGPNAPDVPLEAGQLASQSCVVTKPAFLNLLRKDSQLYKDLQAIGDAKWSVVSFDCYTRAARLLVGGRTVEVSVPPPVSTPGDDRTATDPRLRRDSSPGLFRAARRPAGRGYLPVPGRAAAPSISKASFLARLPQTSPLRRDLERLGPGGWELVDRGAGRVAVRIQGRELDMAVPA